MAVARKAVARKAVARKAVARKAVARKAGEEEAWRGGRLWRRKAGEECCGEEGRRGRQARKAFTPPPCTAPPPLRHPLTRPPKSRLVGRLPNPGGEGGVTHRMSRFLHHFTDPIFDPSGLMARARNPDRIARAPAPGIKLPGHRRPGTRTTTTPRPPRREERRSSSYFGTSPPELREISSNEECRRSGEELPKLAE